MLVDKSDSEINPHDGFQAQASPGKSRPGTAVGGRTGLSWEEGYRILLDSIALVLPIK